MKHARTGRVSQSVKDDRYDMDAVGLKLARQHVVDNDARGTLGLDYSLDGRGDVSVLRQVDFGRLMQSILGRRTA